MSLRRYGYATAVLLVLLWPSWVRAYCYSSPGGNGAAWLQGTVTAGGVGVKDVQVTLQPKTYVSGYQYAYETACTDSSGKFSFKTETNPASACYSTYYWSSTKYPNWRSAQCYKQVIDDNWSGYYGSLTFATNGYKLAFYPSYNTDLSDRYDYTESDSFNLDFASTLTKNAALVEKKIIIRVRVVDDDGNTATPGVLNVYISGRSYSWKTLQSSFQDFYVSAGTVYISAYAKDYYNNPYSCITSATVTVSDSDTIKEVTLKAKSNTARFCGTVKGSDGAALSNSYVSIGADYSSSDSSGSCYSYGSAQTSYNGSFCISAASGNYNYWVSPPWNNSNGYYSPYASQSGSIRLTANETLSKDIVLQKKESQVSGKVQTSSGVGLSKAWVSIWTYGNGVNDWAGSNTNSDGTFTLAALPSVKYNAQAYYWDSTINYNDATVSNCSNQGMVTVQAPASGVTFTFDQWNHNVLFNMTDESGAPATGIYGGASIHNSTTSTTAGYYYCSTWISWDGANAARKNLAPNTDYTMEPYTWGSTTYDLVSSEINFRTGAAGGSSTVTMVAAPVNATICGDFLDEDGKTISPAVNYLYVYGTKGTLWRTATVNDKGTGYCLKVSRGTWTLGYWVDWNSTYASMPPGVASHKIEVASGANVKQDLTFLKTGYIQVKVNDPDGNPVKWAWVVANAHSAADTGNDDIRRMYWGNGCSTDSEGACKITVPASCKEEGTKFFINVYKPWYDLNRDGWTNPEEEDVTVTCTKTVTAATLAFGKLDGEMEVTASAASDAVSSLTAFGTVEAKPSPVLNALTALNQDVVSSAYVTCFSDLGRYAEGTTDATGSLKLKCTSGDLWHCFGVNQLKNNLYISEAADVVCSPTEVATQAVTLKLSSAGTIPDSTSESWDSSTAHTLKLADGFSLYAPSGSLAKSGTVSCKVQPKAQIAYQAANRPANKYGYDVTCTDSNGAAITKFNASLTLCLPISKNQRDLLGLKNSDLKSAYFDEKTGTYANLTNVTVSDDKVCSLTDHFTTFAITGNGNLTGVDGDQEGAIDEQHRTGEAGTDGGGGCGCHVMRSPLEEMINAWWFFLIATLMVTGRLCRRKS